MCQSHDYADLLQAKCKSKKSYSNLKGKLPSDKMALVSRDHIHDEPFISIWHLHMLLSYKTNFKDVEEMGRSLVECDEFIFQLAVKI